MIERRWHYVPSSATALKRALYEASIASTGWTALGPRLKPDAVIAVVPTLAAGVLGSIASRIYRAPLGLIFQDLMGPATAQNGISTARWLSNSLSRVETGLARGADEIGVITEGFRTYLEQRGVRPERISSVRNWAHQVCPEESRRATRERLGWDEREFICLHSGNMGQKQGLDNLLHAAACLRQMDGQCIRIVLAGDGNDRQRLEQEAKRLGLRNVSFLGFQEGSAYGAMLAAADLLIVHQRESLLNSALPSKLASYFQAGGAVLAVASPESQTATEVTRAKAGVLVPPGDPGRLACQILQLSRDPVALKHMGERGREYAARHLDSDAALAQYDQLVGRLLEKKR